MNKINIASLPAEDHRSPNKAYAAIFQQCSEPLGRDPDSTDLLKRHPFDVEVTRIPAGAKNFPYHAHSAQWEYYIILTGKGWVRGPDDEYMNIEADDHFLFKPGEAHQLGAAKDSDLLYYVISDNPMSDACYYPDSKKWAVRCGKQRARGTITPKEYFDDENDSPSSS